MTKKINLTEKFSLIQDFWDPRIAAQFNNQDIRLAKLKGEYVFHEHDEEDEMFFVLEGSIIIDFQTHKEKIKKGELIVVPKGTTHKPIAQEEAHVIIIVLSSGINTGGEKTELTKEKLDWI